MSTPLKWANHILTRVPVVTLWQAGSTALSKTKMTLMTLRRTQARMKHVRAVALMISSVGDEHWRLRDIEPGHGPKTGHGISSLAWDTAHLHQHPRHSLWHFVSGRCVYIVMVNLSLKHPFNAGYARLEMRPIPCAVLKVVMLAHK